MFILEDHGSRSSIWLIGCLSIMSVQTVIQPHERPNAFEFGLLHQGRDDRLPVCTFLTVDEQAVFAARADGADRLFHGVIVEIDAPSSRNRIITDHRPSG